VGFLGLWCHDAAEVVEGMASVEYGYVVEVGCVELMMQLLEWRLLPLLLVKDLNGVLELCEPRSLFVYVLPLSLGALNCGLPVSDGLVFLVKVLDLLLNPGLLHLRCYFLFECLIFPVFHLDQLKLYIPLDNLYW
jgi:hypothetical protein